MNKSESYHIWLKTAYKLFAEEGPDNFSIKEVARLCELPRTNFYYHFENKEDLLDKIIELHFQSTTEIFNAELSKRLLTYIPDLYEVVYEAKLGIQFVQNLFKHRNIPKYNAAYVKGNELSADIIIPKFKDFFNINLPNEQIKPLWFVLIDAWYARLNFDNYTVEYLCASCYELLDTLKPLIELANKQGVDITTLDTPV